MSTKKRWRWRNILDDDLHRVEMNFDQKLGLTDDEEVDGFSHKSYLRRQPELSVIIGPSYVYPGSYYVSVRDRTYVGESTLHDNFLMAVSVAADLVAKLKGKKDADV